MTADEPRRAGTSTFLFTDIEGSTRLIQALGDRYTGLLEEQRRLIGAAVEAHGGRVFGTEGDAVFAVFDSATAAVTAAAQAQRALSSHVWPEDAVVRVRMGVHSGEVFLARVDDYVGLALHQVARITAAGHGGQVLVSEATRRLAATLPEDLELLDLGERRLKDLASPERLYQVTGPGLPRDFPPLRTLDAKPNNLPVQLTSFIGRDELPEARAALESGRLLTLTGPGGTGKTRLALQLAAEAADQFPDGVFFVALDAVRDPALVPSVIAAALGVAVGGKSAVDTLIEHLAEKQVLLVLDNFEQVVDAALEVSRMMREAPQIKVVVTTRIPLRISGEREFPVPPLGLPPPSAAGISAAQAARHEAVRLFAERAMAVQPQFTLTDDNAPLVADIVRRLDGLPLAIELAAARTRVLPVAAIRARLGQHLSLLVGGGRDLPERQQTLRGAIDWSYELLEPPDRRLFERFSVHAGGAFLEQADAVCGPASELGEDVLDGLSSLAEKSLVRAALDGMEDPRFAMLVTIRDYANERLRARDEYEALARRHASAYLTLVESLAPDLTGPDARQAADRLEADHDNLRAALDWAVERREVSLALRFIVAVWRFWQTRGHLNEARLRVEAVLALPGVADEPPELVSRAFGAAGGVAYWQADTAAAHRFYTRALEAARSSDDRLLIAQSLYNFSFAALDQPRPSSEVYIAGRPYLEEALAIFRELGDSAGIADAQWALAISTIAARGDVDEAIARGQEARQRYLELQNLFGAGWASYMLGTLTFTVGRVEQAEEYLDEALEIFARAGDRSGILLLIAGYAILAQHHGQTDRYFRLGGAGERLREETGAGLADTPVDYLDYSLPERPTDADNLRTWEEGRRLSEEDVIAYLRQARSGG